VWPARHYASSVTDPAYPPMGVRFRLKSSFNTSGYTYQARVVLDGLKKYGMVLADNGGAWYISGSPDERWNNEALHTLAQVKGSDFEAVDTSSLMISQDSGQARTSSPPVYSGSLVIKSSPAGATVFIDAVNRGATPLVLTMIAPGNHIIRCTKSGFGDQSQTVPVSANQTTNVNFILETLQSDGSVFVQSNPSGARIYLDNTDTGFVTPKTLTNVSAGSHLIRCSLNGYDDNSQTVSVSTGQKANVTLNLTNIPAGSIFVQSNPTGAKIYLDGPDTGFLTPRTIVNVSAGSHVIRCSLNGYDDNSQTVSVSAGQTANLTINLTIIPPTGSISVQSNPSGAKIYLGDVDTRFVTPKTLTSVSTGSHLIRCSLIGYTNNSQTVSVSAGQTTDVRITLQKSGTVAPKSDFSASVREGGYPLAVQFNDKSTNSPTSWSWKFGDGSTSTEQDPAHTYVKSGMYSVKLKVSNPTGSNGLSRSGYIVVSGSTSTTGSISIQSNPTGAKIYLDDADTGFVTPKTISNVSVGSHIIRCSLSGYSDNSQIISVSGGQTATVSIDLLSGPQTPGSISIQSNPTGAKIYLDDADTGFVTPKTISNVPVGSHIIRCSLSGYSDNSQIVSVSGGQTATVSIDLVNGPQTPGSISIQSNPTGAKIYLDDADTGFVTPKTISNVPVGSHIIRCSLSGYSDNSQIVSVSEGQPADVMITLQKSTNFAPKADLSASTREGGSPLTVQFTDKSTNSPTSWSWAFGDGTTSNEQNPTHTYAKAGMYSVKLKVSNSAGTNGLSRSGYIVVS